MVRVNREARERHMRFARALEALWTGNFRDIWASVKRMATLAQFGRINEAIVGDDIARLQRLGGLMRSAAVHDAIQLGGGDQGVPAIEELVRCRAQIVWSIAPSQKQAQRCGPAQKHLARLGLD